MNVNPISFGSVYKISGNSPVSSAFRMLELADGREPADNNEKAVKAKLNDIFGGSDFGGLRIFRNHLKDVFVLTGQDKVDLENLIDDKKRMQRQAFLMNLGNDSVIKIIREAEEDRFRDLSQLITYSRQDGVLNVDFDLENGSIRALDVEV